MKYPLINPSWGDEERNAVLEVIDSGRLTMGSKVKEFETAFAQYVGSKYAIMVNSGSSANLVAAAAFRYHPKKPVSSGDEAIVPAIGWSTTYSPFQNLKLKVIDVELDTLNMNVSGLDLALRVNTKLIVGVSVLGNPAKLDKIREFADENGLWFLEDNCESMGATLNGKQCGTFGDIGTYSMFFSHHLNTVEGGMIVTDNDVLYELCLMLREHGWDRCIKPDGGFYNFVVPGFNVRPTEIAGAVGLVQLKKLDKDLEVRRANAKLFRKLFGGDERFITQREHGVSSWFSFTMIARKDRQPFIRKMDEAGIECRSICGGSFSEHPVAARYNWSVSAPLKNANAAHHDGWFVGNCGRDLTAELHHLKDSL